MKKTKRILMTLLSFCLMGNVAFAQSGKIGNFSYDTFKEDGVVYAYFTGYTGPAISELVFPEIPIQDAVKYVDEDFARNVADDITASVTKLDLTNVDELYSLTYSSGRKTKGFVNVTEITIGGDISVAEDANYKVSTISFAEGVSAITTSLSPFKSTLTNVELPGSCTTIGENAFSGCSKLKNIKLRNVTSIGDYAFYGSGLNSVSSENDIRIGSYAFANCSALSTVTFGFAKSYGAYAFSGSGKLSSFSVAEGVNVIPEGLFYDCKGLISVELGNVEEIGANAFAHTKLAGTLNLPSSLKIIGAEAFASTDIKTVNLYSDPHGADVAFAGRTMILNIQNDQLFTSGNTYDMVVYNRSKSGQYGAITLPFDFKVGNNNYYEFTHFDAQGMHFYEVESPKADTPYLYTGTDPEILSEDGYTTKPLKDVSESKNGGWYAHGVYEDHTTNHIKDEYYKWAISGGKLKWYKELNIKPYRAYWASPDDNNTPSAEAKVFVHSRNGETTSINMTEVDGLENMVPVYYDLTGRRVLEPQSGNLYIVNGKKVIF